MLPLSYVIEEYVLAWMSLDFLLSRGWAISFANTAPPPEDNSKAHPRVLGKDEFFWRLSIGGICYPSSHNHGSVKKWLPPIGPFEIHLRSLT